MQGTSLDLVQHGILSEFFRSESGLTLAAITLSLRRAGETTVK